MEEILVLVGIASPLIAATAGFAAAWWTTRGQVKRLERILAHHINADERVESLERALDELHSEVERIRDDNELLTRRLAQGGR